MCMTIGFDIGGTNIRVGLIDSKNNLVFCHQEATPQKDVYKKIVGLVKIVPNYKDVKSIGLGVPGMVINDEVVTCRNVPELMNSKIASRLSKEFKIPVHIENDGKIAALGEAICGAGRGSKIMCYVGLGTGVGGGVVIDGKVYTGSNGLGGYFTRVKINGKMSEFLVSGTYMLKMARERLGAGFALQSFSDVIALLKDKNPVIIKLMEEFKDNLTELLLNISATINPDTIVLGGGLMRSKDYFLPDVITRFKRECHEQAKNTKIIAAELDQAGVIGAGLFAKK